MATWKKIVVSGSNVSQLNNDAGYLTAGTFGQANGFATASFDGIDLLANTVTGSLNFASASGQGLNISVTASTDTLTFGLSAIPNSSLANSTITIAGNSTALGGTITAATILSGTGVWSGSAQLPSGIVSGSSLGSANQGEVYIVTNGVQQSAVDLGLQTGDSPTFAGVTAGNVTVGVTDDNTINTSTGNLTINSAGGTTTIDDNLVVSGDLTVNGDLTYINTQNLYVEDKFILVASGSTDNGDGGIIIDRGGYASGNIAFGFDSVTGRWGFQDGVTDTATGIDPTSASGVSGSFVGLVFTEASHGSVKPVTGEFAKLGAIYTAADEAIWIYS